MYIHTYVHTCVSTCVSMIVFARVSTHVCVYPHVRVHVYSRLCACVHVCSCMCVHMCTNPCVCTCLHVCIHTCVCAYPHVCVSTFVCVVPHVCVATLVCARMSIHVRVYPHLCVCVFTHVCRCHKEPAALGTHGAVVNRKWRLSRDVGVVGAGPLCPGLGRPSPDGLVCRAWRPLLRGHWEGGSGCLAVPKQWENPQHLSTAAHRLPDKKTSRARGRHS